MPCQSLQYKALAIGELEAGVPGYRVAAAFGVSPGTISKLKTKFCETGDVKDRPRSGCPRKTTPQEDRFLTLASLRNRRLPARALQAKCSQRYHRRISEQTVRCVGSAWSVVHARVTHRTTLADLKQMLVEEWDAIPQQNVAKLVSSMRRRCHAVASVFGNTTRY